MKETIKQDLRDALKEKRQTKVSTLRMLLASVLYKEKEKRYSIVKERTGLEEKELEKESQLTEKEIIEVNFSEAKKRKEAIEGFEKGGRIDLVEKEKNELEVLQKYLPEQLSEQEIKIMAEQVIKEMGAKDLKDMGRVMGALMPKLKGKAEGGLVSKIVKELLSTK